VEWECLEGDKEWVGTNFSFALDEKEGKTTLRFAHKSWRAITDFYAGCNYNWGWHLTSLKEYCETRKGRPYQSR
jgi:hypothetical protein